MMSKQTCNVSPLKYHKVPLTGTSRNVEQSIRIRKTDNLLGKWWVACTSGNTRDGQTNLRNYECCNMCRPSIHLSFIQQKRGLHCQFNILLYEAVFWLIAHSYSYILRTNRNLYKISSQPTVSVTFNYLFICIIECKFYPQSLSVSCSTNIYKGVNPLNKQFQRINRETLTAIFL